jgi:hypothetical protein
MGLQDHQLEASWSGPSLRSPRPQEAVLVAISCDAFQFGAEDTNNDRVTIEWTNTPDGAAKQFRCERLQGDGMVRRKNLHIEYNP